MIIGRVWAINGLKRWLLWKFFCWWEFNQKKFIIYIFITFIGFLLVDFKVNIYWKLYCIY